MKIDFFLVGSARGGTTTLFEELNTNDGIFLPLVKEPNYFSNVESTKNEDYEPVEKGVAYHNKIIKSEQEYVGLYKSASEIQLKGDCSPSYLWDKDTAQQLFKHNPEAKIIISLRNPVTRAFSHYIMNRYIGVDSRKTFKEALSAPKNNVWGCCNLYLEMGLYHDQVKAYYDLFPKEQIKVIVYEDWIANIPQTMSELFSFLNLSDCAGINKKTKPRNRIQPLKGLFLLNLLRKNRIKKILIKLLSQEQIDKLKKRFFYSDKPSEKLDPQIKKDLMIFFYEDIVLLSRLTGIDFNSKWLH
jgi:hypothetical protein